MTRLLYTTDLHGDLRAYRRLPELCREHGVSILVNGGDMLPKGRDMLEAQEMFLEGEFPAFLDLCSSNRIEFFGLFGNDDLRAFNDRWLALAHSRPGVYDLTERWRELPGGFWIRGNSFVPDYPFGLKDWCLRDGVDAEPVPTRGRAVVSSPDGVVVIEDLKRFFTSRPTLEEHLDSLIDPNVPIDRAILVTHPPPAGLGLGSLWSGVDVGSRSVRSWVDRHQPLLTVSGHIHESPDVERAVRGQPWHTATSGRTTCHQPGQALPHRLTFSIVELASGGVPRVGIEWKQETLR
jgi:uncharacterized protein